MKQHGNTLYVTTSGAYLNKEGESVVVKVDHDTKLRVPVHTLDSIVCIGYVTCTPFLMAHCAENGVAISFLTEHGRYLARVEGPVSGNVLLRREQYRRADDPKASAFLARAFVAAKINNSRTSLLRCMRDHPENPAKAALQTAADRLGQRLNTLRAEHALESVRGIEGDAARIYFETFDGLIVAQKETFFLRERSRRPPLDNMNALLSFLYTLLAHDVSAALQATGLDPAVGFLHRDRSGRASLALDIMEEFRPLLADRLALSLVNLKQVQASGFQIQASGAVWLADVARKEVLVQYQKRKQEEITHPFIGERTTVGMLPFLQARLLSRYLRDDLDGYPPFLWK